MSEIPEIFSEVGVRLDLLLLGWIGLTLLVIGAVGLMLVVWWDWDIAAFLGLLSAVFGGAVGILWLIFMWPYQGQYHHLYRTTATVESVSNVLEQADGDLTRTPVVELSGLDRPAVVDDPRIVRLEGAEVTFTCRIQWHYQAADTYSCEIYSIDEEAAR